VHAVSRDVKGLERDALLEEIERIYRDRYPVFLRVAASVAGNADVGHDAVQDGFADAVRSRRSYRGRGPLEAWIWRAVVNAARDRRRPPGQVDIHADPVAAAGLDVEPGALRRAISRLPERQRLAIFLRYFADLDQAAIGEALGIRPGTVAATLHAARESLRGSLEEVESCQR
jgi:RNA polymerase sigma-70 factor (ECF subfamily)